MQGDTLSTFTYTSTASHPTDQMSTSTVKYLESNITDNKVHVGNSIKVRKHVATQT